MEPMLLIAWPLGGPGRLTVEDMEMLAFVRPTVPAQFRDLLPDRWGVMET
jgi:hypothetical protein